MQTSYCASGAGWYTKVVHLVYKLLTLQGNVQMGGISELRKVFALAAANNVTVMPHSFYDGPGLLAALHVNAALGVGSLVEWRFFDLEARLYGNEGVPKNGSITVPMGPGLGFDPDPEVIERYRVS